MTVVVDLIARYARWMYVICAIGVLLYARAVWVSWRERRRALFTLEREMAGERAVHSLFAMVMFGLAAGALYGVQTYILPRLPQPLVSVAATPTVLLLPSPTPSYVAPTATTAPATTVPAQSTPTTAPTRARPSPTPLPARTATPAPPPAPPPARCANPGARITSPGVNARLSGNIAVLGSAHAPDFQFYKVEIGAGSHPQAWSSISNVHRAQVSDGTLDVWNTDAVPAGDYVLKLTVVDVTGNYPPQNICEVPVKVVH